MPNFLPLGFDRGSTPGQDEIAPLREPPQPLTDVVVTASANRQAVLLLDGFRFGKVTLNVVRVEGSATAEAIGEQIAAANRLFQTCGVTVGTELESPPVQDQNLLDLTVVRCESRCESINEVLTCDDCDEELTSREKDLFGWSIQKAGVLNTYFVRSFISGGAVGITYKGCWDEVRSHPRVVVLGSAATNVLAHELGHAFGLEHPRGPSYCYRDGNLLRFGCKCGCTASCDAGGDQLLLMYYAGGGGLASVQLTREECQTILQSSELTHE